jgi:hypothetical protein
MQPISQTNLLLRIVRQIVPQFAMYQTVTELIAHKFNVQHVNKRLSVDNQTVQLRIVVD